MVQIYYLYRSFFLVMLRPVYREKFHENVLIFNLLVKIYSHEYIRIIAINRNILNNIFNIQASWLTVGKDTARDYKFIDLPPVVEKYEVSV